jgi:hypothetical protein
MQSEAARSFGTALAAVEARQTFALYQNRRGRGNPSSAFP